MFFQKIEYWVSWPIMESETMTGNSQLKENCLRYTEEGQEQNSARTSHDSKQEDDKPEKGPEKDWSYI